MSDPLPRAKFTDPLLRARKARRKELFKATLLQPLTLGLFVVSAVVLYFVAPQLIPAQFLIPIAWIAIIAYAFVRADRRADDEWWHTLLQSLGMMPLLDLEPRPLTPLLRSGDEREILRGGEDGRRQLLIFRSTDIHKDGDGNKTRTHHDYTVVVIRDSSPAIGFLSAHEHRVSFMKFLGDDLRGRTVRGVEEFKVESVDLHERFELRSSTEDGTRARQIFKPSFILWFTHSGVPFEYESGDLVVIADRVLEHAEEFRLLLKRADQIHAAIQTGEVPGRGA